MIDLSIMLDVFSCCGFVFVWLLNWFGCLVDACVCVSAFVCLGLIDLDVN